MAGAQWGSISPPQSRSAGLNHLQTLEKGDAESHTLPPPPCLGNGTDGADVSTSRADTVAPDRDDL